jgi:hypothetical protein
MARICEKCKEKNKIINNLKREYRKLKSSFLINDENNLTYLNIEDKTKDKIIGLLNKYKLFNYMWDESFDELIEEIKNI